MANREKEWKMTGMGAERNETKRKGQMRIGNEM